MDSFKYIANKKSFLIYKDTLRVLGELDDTTLANVVRCIIAWQDGNFNTVESYCQKPMVKLAFKMLENNFIEDNKQWLKTSEKRKDAINKRWSKHTKEYKSIQMNTSDTDTTTTTTTTTNTTTIKRENIQEEKFFEELYNSPIWLEQVQMRYKIDSPKKVQDYLDVFETDCQAKGKTHLHINEVKSHFVSWLKYELNTHNNGNNRKPNEEEPTGFEAIKEWSASSIQQ